MKLISAEFSNFRLLRDLRVDFSVDADKNLSVVRAENESGKTTILVALQWALYGDSALPGRGDTFRLHPIDWDIDDGERVTISASVDFELTTYKKSSGEIREKRIYRIIRSAVEELKGTDWERSSSTVQLFHITPLGASPIDPPEAFINEELPPELREIFFTDGDRALSFIEADVSMSTKRDKVQKAIRSLLGLGVLEDAIRHVKKSATDVNRQAKKTIDDQQVLAITNKIEIITNEITENEEELKDAKSQFTAYEESLAEIDKKISSALQQGDKEKLAADIVKLKKEIDQLDKRIASSQKEHSSLFKSEILACDLLSDSLTEATAILDKMRDQGKIPNTTLPILEERLNEEICICGEKLDNSSKGAKSRCQHIKDVIEKSRKADEIQTILTELYYGSKGFLSDARDGETWIDEYRRVVENRDGLQILRDEAGQKGKSLDTQVSNLPDTDIQSLRETKKEFKELRDRFLTKMSKLDTQLIGLNRELAEFNLKREKILRDKDKGHRLLSELEVIQDVITVLQNAYDQITTTELQKVSELMNQNFIEMIGADPEQKAIINRAVINESFDIIVYGPNDRTLNPDRDLNGASRRALTLSFILALTKISGVEAPNVIDTPLGMTSGFVKRSILNGAIKESSQLILFLTRDEINNCEEIIDEFAGNVFTLTNPAHYPKILVNDPMIDGIRILRCECTHREECDLCERVMEAKAG